MPQRFSYVTLHDLFPEHPKVALLSDAAFRAQVSAICYSHRFSTDGFYPAPEVKRHPRKAVNELVSRGLWEAKADGFKVRGYLDWNDSKADIEARRRRLSEGGAKGAASRWGDGLGYSPGDDSPLVAGVTASVLGSDDLELQEPQPRWKVLFAEWWEVYPRKQGKLAAEKAYHKALDAVDPQTLLVGCERFRDDPNRTAEFTPHPSTWLNQGRWDDDPLPSQNGSGSTDLDRWMEEARRG